MKRLVLFTLIFVFVLSVALWAATLPKELDTPVIRDLWEKAKAEKGFIFTYGMPKVWANYGEIYGEFYRIFGIKQKDIDMGSSMVLARMTQENAKKNDIADLKPSLASVLASRGLTMPYKNSQWDKIPASQKGVGKDGSVWHAAYKGTLGFLVNTNIVKDIPKGWKDLKNPAYKGLIEYLDPRVTGTGVNTIEAVSYAISGDPYNYKAGIEFLAELHKMGLILSTDPKVTVDKFQRGEAGIIINFDYNLIKWKQDLGVPSVIVIPEDGTLSSGGGVIAARNAPHPNTAKLFLEYLFSPYGQKLYAKGYVTPIVEGIELPPEVKDKFPPKEAYKNVVMIDYAKDAKITKKLQEYYEKVVGEVSK